jgi:hypothetical protein
LPCAGVGLFVAAMLHMLMQCAVSRTRHPGGLEVAEDVHATYYCGIATAVETPAFSCWFFNERVLEGVQAVCVCRPAILRKRNRLSKNKCNKGYQQIGRLRLQYKPTCSSRKSRQTDAIAGSPPLAPSFPHACMFLHFVDLSHGLSRLYKP